jgi:hypothetical protein
MPVWHRNNKNFVEILQVLVTVKGARGKVSFDSQNDKYASQLSCEASPKAYLSHLVYQMTNALHSYPE